MELKFVTISNKVSRYIIVWIYNLSLIYNSKLFTAGDETTKKHQMVPHKVRNNNSYFICPGFIIQHFRTSSVNFFKFMPKTLSFVKQTHVNTDSKIDHFQRRFDIFEHVWTCLSLSSEFRLSCYLQQQQKHVIVRRTLSLKKSKFAIRHHSDNY